MKYILFLSLAILCNSLSAQTTINTQNGTGDIVNGNKTVNNYIMPVDSSSKAVLPCKSNVGTICFVNKTSMRLGVEVSREIITSYPSGEFVTVASGDSASVNGCDQCEMHYKAYDKDKCPGTAVLNHCVIKSGSVVTTKCDIEKVEIR